MKKLLLILTNPFISLFAFGQDPDLFGHWQLDRIEIKFSAGVEISDIDPPITPYLIIDEDLEFNGFGACNSFSGSFTYDGTRLHPINYIETAADCETEFHDLIEDEYFMYFEGPTPLYNAVFIGNDGLEHLHLGFGYPGFWLDFIRGELSIGDPERFAFKIYPNPTSNILFISSEETSIDRITIYDISGHIIIQQHNDDNFIDVSPLASGLYFIEVTSQSGKAVERFVKK